MAGFYVPLDDSRTQVARLVARQTTALPALHVEPSHGVLVDEWDAFDVHGDYLNTYTTQQLVWIQGKGYQSVTNRYSGERWSFLQERKPRNSPGSKSRKRRKRHGKTRRGNPAPATA